MNDPHPTKIIWRTFYAGFRDGKQVTAWDKRRDRVHSITRRVMKEQSGHTFEMRTKNFMQKVAA